MSFTTFLIVCPLVFLGGVIDSMAGGGGLITLPAYLASGLPAHLALGTNKMSSFIGATVSTTRFVRHGYIEKLIIIPTIIFALIGSTIGSRLALMVPAENLKLLLLIVLPVVAIAVLKDKSFSDNTTETRLDSKKMIAIAAVTSLVLGCYDGFYGPGTGTFLILVFCKVLRLDYRTAAGNAKVINLASNGAALASFILSGNVNFMLGGTAALFGIAGNYIGSGLVIKRGTKAVKPIIICVLVLLFIKILLDK